MRISSYSRTLSRRIIYTLFLLSVVCFAPRPHRSSIPGPRWENVALDQNANLPTPWYEGNNETNTMRLHCRYVHSRLKLIFRLIFLLIDIPGGREVN